MQDRRVAAFSIANSDWFCGALGAVLSVLVAALHYALNRSFYFSGDVQVQYVPAFLEIAALIRDGELPWITLDSWAAGNLVGEHQYGIFNPFSLALYLAVSAIDSLALVSLALVLAHVGLTAAGVYLLGRAIGVSPQFAVLGALALGTNNFLTYWYATSWLPGLFSFAWLPWALCFVYRSKDQPRFIPLAACFVYLVIATGYPYTTVSLAAAIGILTATLAIGGRYWAAAQVALGSLAGMLMATPAIVSAYATYTSSMRAETGEVAGEMFLSAALSGLITFAFPSFQDVTMFFDRNGPRFGLVELPLYYAAWFTLPALALVGRNLVRRQAEGPLPYLAILASLFFCLATLPDVPPFKWSFRFTPFFHLPLVLGSCWILSRAGELRVTRMRQLLLAAAFVALCLLSLLLSPGYWREHMTFLLLAGGMSYACAALIARQLPALPLLLAGTLVIAVGTALTWRSSSVGRLGVVFPVQDSAAGYRELGAQLPAENVLGLVTEGTFFRDAGLAFPPGSLPMLTDRRTVNGFAAFVQPAYNDKLCLEYVALLEDCIRLWPSLFAPDPALNVTLADLMRLERIVVERGETLRRFERAAGQGWVVDRAGDSVVEFTRARPLSAQPGLLAWLPAGISARMKHLSIRAEEHELKFGVHLGGGIVVFQRAWYPGYRAWLDDVELDVFAHRGILLAVRLPENTQGRGTLRLRYQVPGFPGTLFVAAFGLGLGLLAPLLVPALARQERPA